MEQQNGKGWDKNFIVALLSFIAAVLALVVALTTPELRKCLGLEKDTPAPQQQAVQTLPQPSPTPAASAPPVPVPQPKPEQTRPSIATPPSGPFSATLHENQPQLIEAAKTSLTAAFYDDTGDITAKLTIAPDVAEQITIPTVGSGSKEFYSSAGSFFVHILNVDWNSRTITDSSLKAQIRKKVERLLENPYHNTEVLADSSSKLNLTDCRSARIDRNFRIIFVICEECRAISDCEFCFCENFADKTVVFLTLGPHDAAYAMN